MFKELENHNWQVDAEKSAALMHWVNQAFDSLATEDVLEATRSQIMQTIKRIHPPKNIFDRIEGKIMDLTLERMEEDEEIASRVVTPSKKALLRSIPTVLYRRITPEQTASLG